RTPAHRSPPALHAALPIFDRSVRPGILGLGYEQIDQEPAVVRALGGEPGSWVLQQLVLEVEPFGDVETAKEYVASLRRQALSGRSEEHTSELQSRENLVCR